MISTNRPSGRFGVLFLVLLSIVHTTVTTDKKGKPEGGVEEGPEDRPA